MSRRRLVLGLAALTWAAAAAAQGQPLVTRALDSGVVVRLRFTTGAVEAAKLLAPFGPDSTLVTYCPAAVATCRPGPEFRRVVVPARSVRALHIYHAPQSGRGALYGAGLGVAVTAALCLFSIDGGCSSDEALILGPILAVAGTALGALVGAASGGWGPAP